jgi:hypothetical protein
MLYFLQVPKGLPGIQTLQYWGLGQMRRFKPQREKAHPKRYPFQKIKNIVISFVLQIIAVRRILGPVNVEL